MASLYVMLFTLNLAKAGTSVCIVLTLLGVPVLTDSCLRDRMRTSSTRGQICVKKCVKLGLVGAFWMCVCVCLRVQKT